MMIIKKLSQYSKNINKLLTKIICIMILFSVCFSSLRTAYDSHTSFYKKEPNKNFVEILDKIHANKIYNIFLNYSGLNTGYGFFSPNVSSDFIITHNIYKNNREYLIFSNSIFQTKEGAHRFANLNSLFMEKVESIENETKIDSMRIKYLDMILRRLNNYHTKNDMKIDSIKTNLYLYHFPFLKEYPNVKPKLIQIETNTKITRIKK